MKGLEKYKKLEIIFTKNSMKITYKNKRVLITGGTGTLGTALVSNLLKSKAKEIIVYSRDEYKQSEMAREIKDKRVTYYLGDVRDLDRLKDWHYLHLNRFYFVLSIHDVKDFKGFL